MKQSSWRLAQIAAAVLLTSGCGGGGGQAPAPGPVATGTPAPTPSPTSTPTPTPAPPPFGLASAGPSLAGFIICQSGVFTRDASQRLTGVTSISSTLPTVRTFTLSYLADATFGVRVFDQDGPRFEPQEMATPRIAAYEYFKESNNNNEFEVLVPSPAKKLKYSTIGRYSGDSLCFYAAGGPGTYVRQVPPGDIQYEGISDGIAQIKGATYRLLDTQISGTLGRDTIGLRVQLRGRQPPFDEISGSPFTDLAYVSGVNAGLNSTGEGNVTLVGNGYSGNASYKLSDSDPKSIIVVYSLSNSSGHRIYGAASLEKQ